MRILSGAAARARVRKIAARGSRYSEVEPLVRRIIADACQLPVVNQEIVVDAFESDRREWVPLKSIPDMVARGDVPAANMAAALLLLHNVRLG